MVEGLLHEMDFRKTYLSSFLSQSNRTHTLYFGGGTPSLLAAEEIALLIRKTKEVLNVDSFKELTLEANPDDLVPDYLRQLADVGINRLSIGIQSFHDAHLKWMRRRHNAQQAIDSVKNVQHAGFENITIDLMYGLPMLTLDEWRHDIEQALALNVSHISAYHLSVEPRTLLGRQQQKGALVLQDEQKSLDQFHLLRDLLIDAGYEHYEVSNFARTGRRSVHNSAYWHQQPYWGIGPSAHSFDGKSRQWNVANNIRYMEAIEKEGVFFEKEILTVDMRYNEYLLTTLRTTMGADLSEIEKLFGESKKKYCLQQAQKYFQTGEMQIIQNRLTIPPEHFFVSDGIISELFI